MAMTETHFLALEESHWKLISSCDVNLSVFLSTSRKFEHFGQGTRLLASGSRKWKMEKHLLTCLLIIYQLSKKRFIVSGNAQAPEFESSFISAQKNYGSLSFLSFASAGRISVVDLSRTAAVCWCGINISCYHHAVTTLLLQILLLWSQSSVCRDEDALVASAKLLEAEYLCLQLLHLCSSTRIPTASDQSLTFS